MANHSFVEGLLGFPLRRDDRSAHFNIMDTSRSHRIPRNITGQYIECTNPARFRKTQRPFLADDRKWNLFRRRP